MYNSVTQLTDSATAVVTELVYESSLLNFDLLFVYLFNL